MSGAGDRITQPSQPLIQFEGNVKDVLCPIPFHRPRFV